MTKKYNAYHGDHELKSTLVALAIKHAEQDEYIKGIYAQIDEYDCETFRGCSVGCSIYDLNNMAGDQTSDYGDHTYLACKLGVPLFVVKMQDDIFEGLPLEKSIAWTQRLFSAIPVGADLLPVAPKFLKFVLESCSTDVEGDEFKQQRTSVEQSLSVIENWIATDRFDAGDAADAACAAYACAAVAYAYAYAYARDAYACAAYAAYEKYADKFIELIKECEIVEKTK